ncbi:TOBE domain-containing protein [Methylomonas sp. SURF-2]|uniref:TOBE domain-containing protein n=1 Tax=Methylomonas subterranea TaxID=2952225 RepID=A0ABT1TF18_9GAMM|nr:TOBE domain-containing protein [Methylomonas sp. SURF-2]MCQ8103884.1 TOBE domain-containing protein [Methylomonas sp. SURF-2]
MAKDSTLNKDNHPDYHWVTGQLCLAGMLDTRMLSLLRAIEASGSINQAAKLAGLSYKGAWQIIERANNMAPKVLISTATGGSKGGGTRLTTAGKALLNLFTQLEQQHRAFLAELNRKLTDDPDMLLLLKPLAVKTSATNQLFGRVSEIAIGAVSIEVRVSLKGGDHVVASVTLDEWRTLALDVGSEVLVLVNASEIMLAVETLPPLSARNSLKGRVIRILQDGVDAEVILRLPGGDTLSASITLASLRNLNLKKNSACHALFKSNAPILAALPTEAAPISVIDPE